MQFIRVIVSLILALFIFACDKVEVVYPIYFKDKSYFNCKLLVPNLLKYDSIKLTVNDFDPYSYCYRIYSKGDSLTLYWYNFWCGQGVNFMYSSLQNVGNINWVRNYVNKNNLNIQLRNVNIEKEISSEQVSYSIVRINNSDTLLLSYNIQKKCNSIEIYLTSNHFIVDDLVKIANGFIFEEIYHSEYDRIRNIMGVKFNSDSLILKNRLD